MPDLRDQWLQLLEPWPNGYGNGRITAPHSTATTQAWSWDWMILWAMVFLAGIYIYIYIEREWYLSMIYVVEYTVVCMRMAQKYATSLILLTYGSRWNSSYCRRVLGFDPSPVPLPFLEMATFESSDVKTGTALCCWKTNPADTMGWLWSCFAFACCSSKNRPPLAYHITLPYFTWLWRRFATSLFYADWPINHQSILLHHHAAARPGERVAGLGWGGCEWTLWGLFSIKPFEGPF